jgi:2,3-bisphosphoglycerate-independent phosphoglycerate mutase
MSTTLTYESVVTEMARPEGKKALLLVLDGLGGYRTTERGSELTEASTPNLDRLAGEGSLGLHDPVTRGITPGSGAGHLGLFGYDPLSYEIGRGALSAAGIGFELQPGDVAARVNFCTLDADGTITDRRAGRLPTEEAAAICELLTREIKVEGVEFFLRPEREHRGLLVLRGPGLDRNVTDSDPQREGVPPLDPEPRSPEAKRTAELVRRILDQARTLLAGRERGNFLLLRGFDSVKEMPSFPGRYQVKALAIAAYPMYVGISRLLGFQTHQVEGAAKEEVDALAELLPDHDFVFMHIKKTDSAGEDGDFERKVEAIEEVDALRGQAPAAPVAGRCRPPDQVRRMKGVILAGGTGSRLHPLTRITNKHLLPIYDRPMVTYAIETLVSAGITELMVVTGGTHAGEFLRLLGNGHEYGIDRLLYAYQERPGGIAEALGLTERFVDGDRVVVMLADNVIERSLRPAVTNFLAQPSGARIVLARIDDPAHLRHLGVPELDDQSRVTRILEKPDDPPSNYVVTGIYFYDEHVFDVIPTLQPSGRGELEITDVNNWYVERRAMEYDVLDGFWGDAGESIDAYYEVNDFVRVHGANKG